MKANVKLICVFVSLALTACAGGGGGSGAAPAPNYNPMPNTPQEQKNFNGRDYSEQVDYHKQAQQDKTQSKGAGATVLVMDSGVDLNNKGVQNLNVEKEMTTDQNGNDKTPTKMILDDGHGTRMTQIMGNKAGANEAHYAVFGADFSGKTSLDTIYREGANTIDNRNDVDIVNQSFSNGGTPVTDNLTKFANETTHQRNISRKGALILAAAGNRGVSDANDASSILLLNTRAARELEKRYLTVVGMDADGTIPYNKCGRAQDFCVVANAQYELYGNKNEPVVTGGSSNATAFVSGTAARIKSRYDWMHGEELKKTIVSTTDLHEDKAVYGLGIVNADRALNGYGRLTEQEVLDVEGKKSTYYFDNNMTGNGGITKNGRSALVLTGNNSYTGKNIVNQGSLVLAGENVAETVVNSNGKLVVGTNKVNNVSSGSVTNNGVLDANSANDFIVNGSFTTNGTVNKAVGSTIKVRDDANLSGTLNLTGAYKGYVTKAGKVETLLTANNINGKFTNINNQSNGLIDSQVTQGDKEITVTTRRNEAGKAVSAEETYKGSARDARVLDKLFDVLDKKADLTKKDSQTADVYLQAKNLSKTLFEKGSSTVVNSQENQAELEVQQTSRMLSHANLKEDSVWVDYNGGKAKLTIDGVNGSSHDNSFGVGASKQYGKNTFVVGVNSIDNRWSEKFAGVSKNVKTTGYGLDFLYLYDLNGYNLWSNLGYSHLNYKTFGSAKLYNFGVGVNKQFAVGGFYLTPNVGLQYVSVRSGNLNISDVQQSKLKTKQTTATVDVSAVYPVNTKFALFSKVGVERDLNRKTTDTATFANGSVVVDTNKNNKTRFNVGLGAVYNVTDSVSVSVSANHQQSSNWKNSSVNAGLKVKF